MLPFFPKNSCSVRPYGSFFFHDTRTSKLTLYTSLWRPSPLPFPTTSLPFGNFLRTGMEIRTSVTKYVTDRIAATRQAQSLLPAGSVDTKPGGYQNVSVIKANSMKHMPNFFAKGQVCVHLFFSGWEGGIGWDALKVEGRRASHEADVQLDRSLKRYFSSSRILISRTANTRLESSRM